MLDEVKTVLDFFIDKFKIERYIYLSVMIMSLIVLVVCAVIEYTQKRDYAIIAGIIGAGGALTYCCTQILKMWTDCVAIITLTINKDSKQD